MGKKLRHSELVSESDNDNRKYCKNFVIAVLDTAILPDISDFILKILKYVSAILGKIIGSSPIMTKFSKPKMTIFQILAPKP